MGLYVDQALKGILKDFYVLSGIRIAVMQSDGKEVAAYPVQSCEFCRRVKANPRTASLCARDDQEAQRIASERNTLHLYTCHAGMKEAIVPIREGERLIGYLMMGQAHNLDEEKLRSISSMMDLIASYLKLSHKLVAYDEPVGMRLRSILQETPPQEVVVDKLCQQLNVSQSKLYLLARKELGMTIKEYLHNRQIEQACFLLDTTDEGMEAIAQQCGFSSANYFARIFGKIMGMNPGAYRRARRRVEE